MGSPRQPLFMSAEGFSEMMAIDDQLTLGQLTMNGGNIVMAGNKVTGLGIPSAPGDATTKTYVDSLVVTGGPVKEPLFDAVQMSNSQGILAGEVLYFAGQPSETTPDTVILKNTSLTRTYSFVANQGAESAGTDVSKETTAATAMQRLVTRINADTGNTQWAAKYVTGHGDINNPCVLIYEKATAAGVGDSRIYGTWGTQANFKVVEFATGTTTIATLPYTTKTTATASTSDPAYCRFGLRRQIVALEDGELHLDLGTDDLYSWNADSSTWYQMSGPGSIPLATSAAGGGVIGRVGFDSNKGLSVTSGIAGIALTANAGLQFASPAGTLEIEIEANKGLTTSVNGLATVPDGNRGVATDVNGIYVKVDGSSITFTGGGALQASGASEAVKVENDINVSEAIAKADPVYISGNSTVGKADASVDAKSRVIGVARTAQVSVGSPVPLVSIGPCPALWAGTGVANTPYYLQVGGGIATGLPIAGNRVIQVGKGLNINDLWVDIIDYGKKAA